MRACLQVHIALYNIWTCAVVQYLDMCGCTIFGHVQCLDMCGCTIFGHVRACLQVRIALYTIWTCLHVCFVQYLDMFALDMFALYIVWTCLQVRIALYNIWTCAVVQYLDMCGCTIFGHVRACLQVRIALYNVGTCWDIYPEYDLYNKQNRTSMDPLPP